MDRHTQRQAAVRREWDCWLARLKKDDLCIGLTHRLYWDLSFTVYAAVLYYSPQHRNRVVRTGMFIVPTQNVWIELDDEEEDAVAGFKFHPEFNMWRKMVPMEGHEEVQLTFEFGQAPLNVIADANWGCPIFHREVQMIKGRREM